MVTKKYSRICNLYTGGAFGRVETSGDVEANNGNLMHQTDPHALDGSVQLTLLEAGEEGSPSPLDPLFLRWRDRVSLWSSLLGE